MEYRKLGTTGEELSALGLGCMGMSFAYGPADDKESLATLEKALDLGVNFWDTADMYGNGANEELISKVLVPNRDKIFIATKFGFRFKDGIAGPSSASGTYFDGSPAWMKVAVEQSLKRLKIDTIDLYYAHRVDPNVPIEETVGAMADLVKEGKVRYLGLSEVSANSLRKAHAVHPISAVQSEYSLLTRDVENGILKTTRELGISLVPYSPLARGLVTNKLNVDTLAIDDFRRTLPRYQSENIDNNNKLIENFAAFAASKSCTPAQLALAWVLAQGEDIIPIPGTKKRNYLEENVGAIEVKLSSADLTVINELINRYPIIGERYSEEAMKMVNH
ncbi:aldo/keto reductase [Flavobacterium pectinovorum]|uniref:Aldo/keto reductase n=1 Tax=Flavobacterium pectinovorum TaxID=29533 RepID=A0AB36NZ97_9FLAO|nr:aldo/keto reductase [Flavobacterium pectinovorum]OXB03725.1 aldo/keto reductase [Flavobacterium pectinovorum]SHL64800.1 Predicted oxidoreductase [Flavobacterium pectinovorum]